MFSDSNLLYELVPVDEIPDEPFDEIGACEQGEPTELLVVEAIMADGAFCTLSLFLLLLASSFLLLATKRVFGMSDFSGRLPTV